MRTREHDRELAGGGSADWGTPLASARAWLWSFAVWTAIATLTATIRWQAYRVSEALTWIESIFLSLADEWSSAVFSPLLCALGWRWPLDAARWKRALPRQALAVLVAGAGMWALSTLATHWIAVALERPGWQWAGVRDEWLQGWIPFVLASVQIAIFAKAWRSYAESRARRQRELDLRAELARAQLQALRAQLEPHFLFNTLNAIVALIRSDPEAAERMLIGLSEFLRLTLEDLGVDEVSLRRELEYLDRYLALQKARFRERLRLAIEVAPDALDCAVPPLLLQPLVENAIRHGISRSVTGGTISVRGRREGGELALSVTDDGQGLSPNGNTGAGLGLANTRARLERLYGASQSLELVNGSAHGCEVRIRVPARALAP